MKKWIAIGTVLIVAAGAGFAWKNARKTKVAYKEFTVERGDLETTILATGTVQPENRLEIKAPIAGRIERVLAKEGEQVRKGQALAWMSSSERAAMTDAARAHGAEELRKWEELYKPTPILAPLPGMIILRNVEPGQTITAADAIFAMSDRLTVKAQVDETDLAKIRLHQEARIVLDAYSDQELPATVDQIAYEAKTVNNVTTYVIDVLPLQAPDFLRSGMTANVSFLQNKKDQVLLLAAEAITLDKGKPTVLMRAADGPPQAREIQTGASDGKRTEVTAGLQAGDVVVRAEVSGDKASGANPFSPFGNKRPGQRSTGGKH